MRRIGVGMKLRASKLKNDITVVMSGIHGSKWSVSTYRKNVCLTQTTYPNRVAATAAYKLWK